MATVTFIKRGEPEYKTNSKGERYVSGYKKGEMVKQTVDFSKGEIATPAGGISRVKRTTDSSGRVTVEGRSTASIIQEYDTKRAIEEATKPVNTQVTKVTPLSKEEAGFSNAGIQPRSIIDRKTILTQRTPIKTYSYIEPSSKSVAYASRAEAADIVDRQPLKAAGYQALSFGSAVVSGDFKQAGKTLFPVLEGEQIKTRTGKYLFAIPAQEAIFGGVTRVAGKGVSLAKTTFGTKPIVGKLTGTGVTETRNIAGAIDDSISIGTFQKQRVIVKPFQETKTSQVIIQDIGTISRDIPKKSDLILDTGKLRQGLFTKRESSSVSVITSKNLRGEKVFEDVFVKTKSYKVPYSKNTYLRTITSTRKSGLTSRELGITKIKQVSESGSAARSIREELTIGKGVTQRVRFAEKEVALSPQARRSSGFVENKLVLEQQYLPKTKDFGFDVGSPKLPVTLKAGITKPVKGVGLKGLSLGSGFVSSISGVSKQKNKVIGTSNIPRSDTFVDTTSTVTPTYIRRPKYDITSRATTDVVSTNISTPKIGGGTTTNDFSYSIPTSPRIPLIPVIPKINFGAGGGGSRVRKGKGSKRGFGLPPTLTGLTLGIGTKTKKGKTYSGLGVRI